MKQSLPCLFLLTAFLFTSSYAADDNTAERDINKKIQGVWTIVSMDVGTGKDKRTVVPKAFMMFITEKHYSAIRDLAVKPGHGRQTAYGYGRSFMADAGTYEFNGNDLVVHHMAAMFPVLGSMTFGCEMEGDDTLILTPQYDKMEMPGMNYKFSSNGNSGFGDMAVRYVFKRLE